MLFSKRKEKIDYVLNHRAAIIKLERDLTGKNTFLTIIHDLDKLIMLKMFVPIPFIKPIHRFYSRHHTRSFWKNKDYYRMFLDWESARYTKADKPLSAVEYANLRHKDLYLIMKRYEEIYINEV